MADIFDKFFDNVSKGINNVSESSKVLVEKNRLNMAINGYEKEKNQLFETIGSVVYNMLKSDEFDIERLKPMCDEIDSKNSLIDDAKEKIAALEFQRNAVNTQPSEKMCECGNVNIGSAKFCGKCGRPL